MTDVAGGLLAVRERIAAACRAAGRDPADVLLVAVSKGQPPEKIRAAYDAGHRDFGENYVQELAAKAEALASFGDLRWHFIGHLQTNKVKQVVRVAARVESVDSVRLAEALGRAAVGGEPVHVHVQVNVGGERQKSGCAIDELPAVVRAVRGHASLRLDGLMTVPPFDEDPERARAHFRRLRELASEVGVPGLSMGMSGDFETAIHEGATSVRVGTAIFGARASSRG